MSDSPRCPVCDVLHGPPRWPSVRTVAWTDECACSDAGLCVSHQYGHNDRIPERPPAPELSLRAEVEFERRRVEHTALLMRFAEYAQLAKERDEARAVLDAICVEFEGTVAHADWRAAGSKGMSVPYHGDFASAAQLPSVVGRMRWWVREMRKVLGSATP